MEIESLRLDFLTLIILINITKAQNISEKEENKNKNKKLEENQKNPGHRARPRSRAAWVARDPGLGSFFLLLFLLLFSI